MLTLCFSSRQILVLSDEGMVRDVDGLGNQGREQAMEALRKVSARVFFSHVAWFIFRTLLSVDGNTINRYPLWGFREGERVQGKGDEYSSVGHKEAYPGCRGREGLIHGLPVLHRKGSHDTCVGCMVRYLYGAFTHRRGPHVSSVLSPYLGPEGAIIKERNTKENVYQHIYLDIFSQKNVYQHIYTLTFSAKKKQGTMEHLAMKRDLFSRAISFAPTNGSKGLDTPNFGFRP